jgi:hypothetical protein
MCVSRTDCGSLAAYVFGRYTTWQGPAETSGYQAAMRKGGVGNA